MSNPIITFLMCYRIPDRSDNLDIGDILINLDNCFPNTIDKPNEKEKIEVLIKIDEDDILAKSKLYTTPLLKQFQFPVRIFETKRGEGRNAFNYHYMHLFSQRSPSSRYIGFLTDDVVIDFKLKHFFDEIEKDYKDLEYAIFTDSPYREYERHSTPYKERLYEVQDFLNHLDKIFTSFLTESYPIVTTKLFEVIGNLGWQVNIDATLALLNVLLYKNYKINLYRVLACKYFNRIDNQREDKYAPYTFNKNLRLDASSKTMNPYLITLMSQQAKNIYLNMANDNVLDKYQEKE